MKILFTGGGTGGHFFPIIAVAEAVNKLADKQGLVSVELFYMSDSPYDEEILSKTKLTYIPIMAGKKRTYASIQNVIDKFKMAFGCVIALWKLFVLYPDVVFGKGGYASFPALFAARLLRIPVIIHESDIIPGNVNAWAGSFATKIAVSYPEAAARFEHKERVAYTGQPIRNALLEIPQGDPYELLHVEKDVPVILVTGGSQGAERINEELMDILPRLVEKCQIIHQTGENNFAWMTKRADSVLPPENPHKSRYHPYAFLSAPLLRHAAGLASLVISRAGSSIFEIALWEVPSILIPLPIARNDHQRENAYSFARAGACTVIEESNLKPELFYSVIDSIMTDKAIQEKMRAGCRTFTKLEGAEKIASALLAIGQGHDAT